MRGQFMQYTDGHTQFEGYVTIPQGHHKKYPAVIVSHDWSGCNEAVCKRADQFAELGYVGFAIDMYGERRVGQTVEEKKALMMPVVSNRALLQQRILAALNFCKSLAEVDENRVAAIGYCFGGLCILDLARAGGELQGVISVHGLLNKPDNIAQPAINTKVLVLHGYDDPMAPPAEVIEFAEEMKTSKCDWQIHMYGNTVHAFTNPQANDPEMGTVYNALADQRSWQAITYFLQHILN